MLEQILDHIHNYFVKEETYGEFEIRSGVLIFDGLLEGQYFKIEGSVLNDGVHRYPDEQLRDETFNGCVKSLAVPNSLLMLADEIEDWADKYGEVASSPFQSESFGNYSYSKGGGANRDSSGGGTTTWQDIFRTRLNAYRKIS